MGKSKFTEAHITYALREAEAGTPVLEVCRKLGITEPPNRASFDKSKKRISSSKCSC
jgi:hypothetical protein